MRLGLVAARARVRARVAARARAGARVAARARVRARVAARARVRARVAARARARWPRRTAPCAVSLGRACAPPAPPAA